MSKNWNGLSGPVTLKNGRGETWSYPDIMSAATEIRRGRIEMSDAPLPLRISDGWLGHVFPIRYVLVDECGLIIPVWRVRLAINDLGPRPLPAWSRRFSGYDPATDFRKGPVPGTGRGRGRGYCRYLRHVRTRQEMRENLGLEDDLRDLEDFPVRVKIRSRRKNLPTLWDDVCRARRGDCWKAYRKTQRRAVDHDRSDHG